MNDYFNFFFFCTPFGKKGAKAASINKNWIALNTFYYLLSLKMNRFKYTLADTMDARFLELCLITSGNAGFADINGNIMNLAIQSGSTLTPYGYYLNYQLADYNGKSYGAFVPNTPDAVNPDSAIIWDNMNHVPGISRIIWYAERLTTLQSSIGACIANLKGTTIITCSREQKKPIEKAWRAAGDGLPVILDFGKEDGLMQLEPKIITNPQTADILESLQEAYDKTLAEFCVENGINANSIINKLSGVSASELQQTAERTQIALFDAFNARREGLDGVNRLFGTNCKVEISYNTVLTNESEVYNTNITEGDKTEGGD